MNDDNPPNAELAETLAQREKDRRKRARRSTVDSFRELNQRRAENGLPPVWPNAKATEPPPEQTAMKNGANR